MRLKNTYTAIEFLLEIHKACKLFIAKGHNIRIPEWQRCPFLERTMLIRNSLLVALGAVGQSIRFSMFTVTTNVQSQVVMVARTNGSL